MLMANNEQQIAAKRKRVMVPEQPSKSSDEADRIDLRSKTAVAGIHGADAKLPVVKSRGTQELTVQEADG